MHLADHYEDYFGYRMGTLRLLTSDGTAVSLRDTQQIGWLARLVVQHQHGQDHHAAMRALFRLRLCVTELLADAQMRLAQLQKQRPQVLGQRMYPV